MSFPNSREALWSAVAAATAFRSLCIREWYVPLNSKSGRSSYRFPVAVQTGMVRASELEKR